jgi:hypothetical protein
VADATRDVTRGARDDRTQQAQSRITRIKRE